MALLREPLLSMTGEVVMCPFERIIGPNAQVHVAGASAIWFRRGNGTCGPDS
jgi:hypothetical protein